MLGPSGTGKLTDAVAKGLLQEKLRVLRLEYQPGLGDAFCATISSCGELTELSLKMYTPPPQPLSEASLQSLASLRRLKRLDLSGGRVRLPGNLRLMYTFPKQCFVRYV